MNCDACGTKTLGFIVSTQGGTRGLTVAVPRSRKTWCRPCGEHRVAELNARDERVRLANKGATDVHM